MYSCMLSLGDTVQIQRFKQIESKMVEKDTSCKQQPQEI